MSYETDFYVHSELYFYSSFSSSALDLSVVRIDNHQIQISSKAAQYFYCGLIADNIRFSISNVRKETFEAAGYLIECGANVLKANELNFSISMSDYQYENMVRNRSVRKENCLYSIMETEDYIPYQSYENAKDKVYV